MAALTAVTVGGVYAAFNYAGDFNSVSKTEARMVSVAAAKTDHSAGSYEVTVTTLSILIDSAKELNQVTNEKPQDNRACMKITGDIVVTFDPADNIDPNYAANGLPTTVSFDVSDANNNWSYIATDKNGVKGGTSGTETTWMFTVDNTKTYTIELANVDTEADDYTGSGLKWSANGNGTFTCNIPASVIEEVLKFNEDIVLETAREHDEFYDAVLANSLKITVKANVPNA